MSRGGAASSNQAARQGAECGEDDQTAAETRHQEEGGDVGAPDNRLPDAEVSRPCENCMNQRSARSRPGWRRRSARLVLGCRLCFSCCSHLIFSLSNVEDFGIRSSLWLERLRISGSDSFETSLFGSSKSPKVIAATGHVCTQAGCRPSANRSAQKLHFSTVPT